MPITRSFHKDKVMQYVRVPRIKKLCPKERIYLGDDILYIIYKSNDDTYPDVGKITTKFYDRPMLQCFWGIDELNELEKFLEFNIKERKNVIKLIEELSKVKNIEEDKIEEIFERYKGILKPVCELYKLCYYMSSVFHALDIRVYKGKPTVVNRSLVVYGMIKFLKGEMTKQEAMNVWSILASRLDATRTLKKVSCVSVGSHYRHLRSDRFVNKKGERIFVKDHLRLVAKYT